MYLVTQTRNPRVVPNLPSSSQSLSSINYLSKILLESIYFSPFLLPILYSHVTVIETTSKLVSVSPHSCSPQTYSSFCSQNLSKVHTDNIIALLETYQWVPTTCCQLLNKAGKALHDLVSSPLSTAIHFLTLVDPE